MNAGSAAMVGVFSEVAKLIGFRCRCRRVRRARRPWLVNGNTVPLLLVALVTLGCGEHADVLRSIPIPNNLLEVEEPRLVKAVEDARRAVGKQPRSADAWGRLGNIYVIHEWEMEAAACYRQAIALEPGEFRWHYYLGRSVLNDNPEEAAGALAKAISLDDEYVAALVYSATALRKLNRLNDARRGLQRAIELDRENPLAHLYLGELALNENRLRDAREHLEHAVSLNPEQSEAHASLAQVYMALGETQTALGHAKAARNPSKSEAMRDDSWGEVQLAGVTTNWFARRGTYYLQRGDFKRAVEELEVAVAGEPRDPEVWLNFGSALLRAGRYAEALKTLERALEETHEVGLQSELVKKKITPALLSKVYLNLGVATTKLGDRRTATRHLQEACRLDPESYDAHYNLAIVHHVQGHVEATIRCLTKCQRIRPDPKVAGMLMELKR